MMDVHMAVEKRSITQKATLCIDLLAKGMREPDKLKHTYFNLKQTFGSRVGFLCVAG